MPTVLTNSCGEIGILIPPVVVANKCRFDELCSEYHPEEEERRKNCTDVNCKRCARYWAFLDGYNALDE